MTTHQVNDVFDAFVAAKAAIDKVPELEARIAALNDERTTDLQIIDLYKADLEKAQNERDMLADQQRASEEALEKARKSNEDLASRLDLVLSTFRAISSDIGTTLSVVSPEPEPVIVLEPEPIPEPVPVVTEPIPRDADEASYRDRGKSWEDTNGNWHTGTGVSVSSSPTTTTPIPISSAPADGPSTSAPSQPVTSSETAAIGSDTITINGVTVTQVNEVSPPADPFAPSTASPSATAAPIYSAVYHAEPSDSASSSTDEPQKLPDWLYRPVGEGRI